MKKLLFAIIAGLLFSCSNPTEPGAKSVHQESYHKHKIVTALIRWKGNNQQFKYKIFTTKTNADTAISAILSPNQLPTEYFKVDSIWGYVSVVDSINNFWFIKTDKGDQPYFNAFSSYYGYDMIKMWKEQHYE